jgi:predicted flap endonuclease-1-like 5' DNA nuclease
MTNPVHLLSVAALLLIAFLVGATAGMLLRRLAFGAKRTTSPAVAEVILAEAPPSAPLVASPVIAPLPVAPKPAAAVPADIPVPDFTEAVIALASAGPALDLEVARSPDEGPRMQPAHVAGETTSGIAVPAPRHENPVPVTDEKPATATNEERSAEVIPFATAAAEESDPSEPADPAVESPSADTVAVEPTPEIAVAIDAPGPTQTAAVPADVAAPALAVVGEVLPDNEAQVSPDTEEIGSAPVAEAQPAVENDMTELAQVATPPVVDPAPEERSDTESKEPAEAAMPVDEDAAMRAIEGSGPPRRAAVRKRRPVEPPEGMNEAVASSKRAVSAARRTAETVVAEVEQVNSEVRSEAGRPAGLGKPRAEGKDELTHIMGVLPVIETALNKIGIYHFDQIVGLTDENVAWIEAHLGIAGRVGREHWREQARELAAVTRPRRAAEQ